MRGMIAVRVESCMNYGIGLEMVDAIVQFEIAMAVRMGQIEQGLAVGLLEMWFGSGDERMRFVVGEYD